MNSFLEIILLLTGAIAFIIVGTSILKFHPVLILFTTSFLVGIISGLEPLKTIEKIGSGFGSLLGSIGLLVVFGSILGVMLEKSGALQKISEVILHLFGTKRVVSAMACLGFLVGVPVFCDSGFIILSKLSKIVAQKGNVSAAATSIALAGGLYTTHTLVPPTPGPIAAAGNLGVTGSIGIIILIGFLVAIPVILVAITYASFAGAKIELEDLDDIQLETNSALPLIKAAGPILLPILLIMIASIINLLEVKSNFTSILVFVGNPNIALFLGIILSMLQFPKISNKDLSSMVSQGITQAGPILVLTGVGGSFGAILKETPINQLAASFVADGSFSPMVLLFIAFGLAALIKTSQGSSTSAIVITSSLLVPFTQSTGFDSPVEVALLISSIGAGAMTVSHANDSYFWVVTQFSGFKVKDAYRGYTITTFLQGLTALLGTVILYFMIGN